MSDVKRLHTHSTVGEALTCHTRLVDRLPAYEVAVEALERIARPVGSGYDGDVHDREALVRWMVAEARTALARLRETVPAPPEFVDVGTEDGKRQFIDAMLGKGDR